METKNYPQFYFREFTKNTQGCPIEYSLAERVSGKQGKCIYTCHFRAAKMLVGVPPDPLALLATLARSPGAVRPLVCGPSLSLLGLIFPPGQAEQMIHVPLDGHQFPHFPLGLPVFGIEGLFLVGQLPAGFFEWKLCC